MDKTKFFLVLAVIVSACGPASKLRRAERLITKAEAYGAKWHVDTLWRTVEISVPEVTTDTIFKATEGDTVFLTKDRLHIQFRDLPGDSVFIEGTCDPDTVKVNVPVEVTKTIEAKNNSWIWYLVCYILGMLTLLILYIRKHPQDLNITLKEKG